MSTCIADWPLASADGLPLSDVDCLTLLDYDILNDNNDLLTTLPNARYEAVPMEKVLKQNDDSSSFVMYPPSPAEEKPPKSELETQLLEQIDSIHKFENLSEWLEEKMELPPFEPVQLVHSVQTPLMTQVLRASTTEQHQPAPVYYHQHGDTADHTEQLLREFETVYDNIELTHLTPPQSPPSPAGPASRLLQSYAQQVYSPQGLDVIEMISPQSSPQYSTSSEEDYSDSVPAYSSYKALGTRNNKKELTRSAAAPYPQRRKSDEEYTPRDSSQRQDRRSRKKEQNKNAATRYRQKKKAEVEVLLQEEHGLRLRHDELDTKCSDLQREIRYLKGLMRDLFKAKGLIK